MLFVVGFFIFTFVFDRMKNKIICYLLNRSLKCIKWHKSWHEQNNYNMFLDWLLI